MDSMRFDKITADFAQEPTRRGLLRLLGAATFSASGLTFLDAEAKKRGKKGKGKGKKKKTRPNCNDGKKNGTETDVDCGGGKCPRCAKGKTCSTRDDCTTALCVGGACKEPANQAECGLDSDGSNCATRDSAAGERICTKINGTFFSDGTCESRCNGAEQCVLPGAGVECVLPCGA